MPYIYEMFSSIQGEGAYTGYPAYFVRFAGCNVHCKFCDTAYAQNSMDGEFVTHVGPTGGSWVQELFELDTAISLSPKKVPFMHPDWLVHASQLKVLVDIDGPILPQNFPELDSRLDV